MSKIYTFTDMQLMELVNSAYVSTILALHKEGLITEGNAGKAQHNYSVIIESPQWLPKFLSKWLNFKDDQIGIRLARVINRDKAMTKGCE
jgi:hypothetical protein